MYESPAVLEIRALKPRWRSALAMIAEKADNYTHGLFGWAGGGIPENPYGWSVRDARALVRRGLVEEGVIPGWSDVPAYPGFRPTERGRLLAAGMVPSGKRGKVHARGHRTS